MKKAGKSGIKKTATAAREWNDPPKWYLVSDGHFPFNVRDWWVRVSNCILPKYVFGKAETKIDLKQYNKWYNKIYHSQHKDAMYHQWNVIYRDGDALCE